MKLPAIVCSILLFLALAKLPIMYYTFLRITVTIVSALIVVEQYKKVTINFWVVAFVIIALVFNPIMPVYLYKRTLWMPVDVLAGLVFLGYSVKRNKKDKNLNIKNYE